MAIYSQGDIEQLMAAGFSGTELGEIMAQPTIPVTTMTAIEEAGATPFLTPEGIRAIPLETGRVVPPVVPKEAGFGALVPALFGLAKAAFPVVAKAAPWVASALAGMGMAGLFGGETGLTEVEGAQTPVPLGGPGLPEPGKPYLIKEWHITYPKGRSQFYLVQNAAGRRYIMRYNVWNKTWKWWAWRKPAIAVIGKNMPSHKMLTRLRRNMKRHGADARTILKITNPVAYAKTVGYRKYSRRR